MLAIVIAVSEHTLTTGAAVVGLAFAAAAGLGGRIYKSLADGYRGERDLAHDQVRRLEDEKADLGQQVNTLKEKVAQLERIVADLRAKDVSALFDLLARHDRNAQEARTQQGEASQQIVAGLSDVARTLAAIASTVTPPGGPTG